MPIGVEIQLHDAAGNALASETGITALWWDEDDPTDFTDFNKPTGRAIGLATDAEGWISLDLSAVSALAATDHGFLLLYKGDESDFKDSKLFASKVEVESITSGDALAFPEAWERPADWLELPSVTTSDEKFVGLLAVFDDASNCIALSAAGNYTVDWGDGSEPEDVSSGVTAEHEYDYSAISSETLSSRGYKQVIVTVTPQAAQTFSEINLQKRHSSMPARVYSVPWLDMAMGGASLAKMYVGNNVDSYRNALVALSWLERVTVVTMSRINLGWMFSTCAALQSVSLPSLSSVTNTREMFFGCFALRSIHLSGLSSVETAESMFYRCSRLSRAVILGLSAATTIASMFRECVSLLSVTLSDLSSVENASFVFNQARALQSVSLPALPSVTTLLSAFESCDSLQQLALPATPELTNAYSMFWGCRSLEEASFADLSKVTNLSYLFNSCETLNKATLPATPLASNASNMFNGCRSLRSVELGDASGVTSVTNMFNNCGSLSRIDAGGLGVTFSIANCNLSADALDELYGSLGTVTSQTITVSGNWGTSGDDPTIATAKGWTVTG